MATADHPTLSSWYYDRQSIHGLCWSDAFPNHLVGARVVRRVGVERWCCRGHFVRTCGYIVGDGGRPRWLFACCGRRNRGGLRGCDVVPSLRGVLRSRLLLRRWTSCSLLQRWRWMRRSGGSRLRERERNRVLRGEYGNRGLVVPIRFGCVDGQCHWRRYYNQNTP